MSRPKASPPSANPPQAARNPARPSAKSSLGPAAAIGGIGGGTIAGAAQQITNPTLRFLFSGTAPFVATAVAAVWPSVLAWVNATVALQVYRMSLPLELRRLGPYVQRTKEELKDLSAEEPRRIILVGNIEKAQRRIDDLIFRLATDNSVPDLPVS